MPKYDVTAIVDRETSVQETSKLFEGLCRLESRGSIRLGIRPCSGREMYPRVVRLTVRSDSAERDIAIDLSDQRDLFHLPDLKQADIYFKRSFQPSALSRVPSELMAKVQPFGLNNPAASLGTKLRMLVARAATGRDWRALAVDARQLFALPSPRAFECAPHIPAEPVVLFQTRLWPDDDPDVVQINEERATLLRALRETFGTRFVGGAIPDDFARKHYGDLISPFPSSMRAYPQLVRRALIGVYSRGLHNSIAFKMSEYLAASRCIVGQPPDLILPEPLVSGKHYLEFRNPDECVAQCERLLVDDRMRFEMRNRNWDYYRSQVEPAVHLQRILDRSFSAAASEPQQTNARK